MQRMLRHLRATLPAYDFVYLGDSGRAPYGGRDVDTLLDFSEQCVERLFSLLGVVVVACHTVSRLRYGIFNGGTPRSREFSPNTRRHDPGGRGRASEALDRRSRHGLGHTEVAKLGTPGPRLAHLKPAGGIARLAVARYVEARRCRHAGCRRAHYPLLLPAFQAVAKSVRAFVAQRLRSWLGVIRTSWRRDLFVYRAFCAPAIRLCFARTGYFMGAVLPTVERRRGSGPPANRCRSVGQVVQQPGRRSDLRWRRTAVSRSHR